MKKLNKSSILIVIGLIISITAMETVPVELFDLNTTQTINQADDDSGENKTSLTTNSVIALPLSLEFQIDPELFLLNILPENEEEELSGNVFTNFLDAQHKVLRVLFRQIISPNAP